MDLKAFREIVDRTPTEIAAIRDQPEQLYAYVDLVFEGSYQLKIVGDALNDRIRAAFKAGHRTVFSLCRSLMTDLIREHVIFILTMSHPRSLLSIARSNIARSRSRRS